MREEIDQIVGKKMQLTYDDIAKLEYTSSVYKETLRMWPPVSTLMRTVDEDCELCGYSIPKGTSIMISPFTSGRNEKYFKNANKFQPERFMDIKNNNDDAQ